MRRFTLALLFLLQVCPLASAFADELRPAYLSIQETRPDEFSVLWKVPAVGDKRLGLYLRLPDTCVPKTEPVRLIENAAYRERWTAVCEGGLRGRPIAIDGLRSTATDALARIEYRDGSVEIARLTPEEPRFVVAGVQTGWEVAWTYFLLGVDHILSGYDHLLFVFALILLINDFWMLIKTITAFTLATASHWPAPLSAISASLNNPWKPRSRSASPSSPANWSSSAQGSDGCPRAIPGWWHSPLASCMASALPVP